MIRTLPHDTLATQGGAGERFLTSRIPLGSVVNSTGDWLHKWAKEAPSRTFLAERYGKGWRALDYSTTLQQVRALAQSLLARGLNEQTPIAVLSGNGVDHGILSLAAQYVGIPLVPVAEQYALIPEAHYRLLEVLSLTNPSMIYVADAARFGQALTLDELKGKDIIASQTEGAPVAVTLFSDLLKGNSGIDVDQAFQCVTPDTLARILLTSGSTSSPKGVITSQKMLCVNQAQIGTVLPFLHDRPPRLLDWLPWNHVFGGSHNFNLVLAHGGSLYIDDGKPTPTAFGRMLENLSLTSGTIALNVPAAFAQLVAAMSKDDSLKRAFFSDLDLMFYAGASLPAEVWQALETQSMEVRGNVPLMISSWGMTETAPAALMVHESTGRAGVVGVPLPGVRVKLIPTDSENRYDLRVAGPNLTTGYYRNKEKTQEAFDEEGYLITGDAVRLCNPEDPNAGLLFDGRLTEDFKLLTGTWVRAANLRLEALEMLSGLAQDVVIAGQDQRDVGLLIFPLESALNPSAVRRDGVLEDDTLKQTIRSRLSQQDKARGSSTKIARFLTLAEPPSISGGEITPKGNLNSRNVLSRRADLLAKLYDDEDPASNLIP